MLCVCRNGNVILQTLPKKVWMDLDLCRKIQVWVELYRKVAFFFFPKWTKCIIKSRLQSVPACRKYSVQCSATLQRPVWQDAPVKSKQKSSRLRRRWGWGVFMLLKNKMYRTLLKKKIRPIWIWIGKFLNCRRLQRKERKIHKDSSLT